MVSASRPSLLLRALQRSVISGRTLTLRLTTAAHARVTVVVTVAAMRMVVTGRGQHRRHLRRSVVLYRAVSLGRADGHGRYRGTLRITYAPIMAVRATLTVTVRTARGATSRRLPLTIQPRRLPRSRSWRRVR